MKNDKRYLRMRWIVFLLIFLTMTQISSAEEVRYTAIVMKITGKVSVSSEKGKKFLDLGLLLYPGDMIETTESATITINYLESGQEEQWPGGMKFTVGKTQSSPELSQVRKQNRKIQLPNIKTPRKGGFTLKSLDFMEKEIIEVKGLSNTWTLEERPTFRWDPVSGAEKYKVIFFKKSLQEPLWQSTTTETEISYPQSQLPLNFGSHYNWELKALKNEIIIAEKLSCFYLPTQEELTNITKEKKGFVSQFMENPDDSSNRLAYIFFLENHHLYDEAIDQYRNILGKNKESSSIKKREELLLQIRNSRCDLSED